MIKDSFGYRKKCHYFSYRKACDEAYLKKYLKNVTFLKNIPTPASFEYFRPIS